MAKPSRQARFPDPKDRTPTVLLADGDVLIRLSLSDYLRRCGFKVLEAALSGQAVYYHRIATPQSNDALIYQRLDHPTWIVSAMVSDDGRYVFLTTHQGSDNNNQLHFIDLGGLNLLAHHATGLPTNDGLVLDHLPPDVENVIDMVGWHRLPGLARGQEHSFPGAGGMAS